MSLTNYRARLNYVVVRHLYADIRHTTHGLRLALRRDAAPSQVS